MRKNKSRYLALYERVRDDIIAGVYPHSKKLPSKRTMASDYGVSVITVEHAYELLEEEGYIVSSEKKGYFVIYDPNNQFPVSGNEQKNNEIIQRNVEYKSPDKDGLSFSQYARTVRKVISAYGERIMERSESFGCELIRKAIASYIFRSRKLQVDPRRIIIGSGAEYLYGLIIKVLGNRVVYGIESPSYKKISYIYESEHAKTKALSLTHDGIESTELWKAEIQALHITPYRSYPSGVTASASKKHEYLKWCNEKNAIIIEDDVESEFSPSRKPEETVFYLNKGKNVIYVNTFTRTIGPFLRVAYMVVPEDMVDNFKKTVGFLSCTVPTPEQYVIAELLENGEFERHINRIRRRKRDELSQK